jgi:tRNA pseudouridine55 synthase
MTNPIGGFLLLHKAQQISSHQALSPIKKKFECKVGHNGTLDPLATGTLVCAIGQARKYLQFIHPDAKKNYKATIQLGIQTDSGDITGKTIGDEQAPTLSIIQIKEVLQEFIGVIEQTPPLFSALKYKGKPYYRYARAGQEIPIKRREVVIESIDFIEYKREKNQITIEACVGSGTYIRSLAEDIANAFGTIGCLAGLERKTVQPWSNHPTYLIDEVIECKQPDTLLLPVDSALLHYPELVLDKKQIEALQHGITIENTTNHQSQHVRVYDAQNQFKGLLYVCSTSMKAAKMLQHDV